MNMIRAEAPAGRDDADDTLGADGSLAGMTQRAKKHYGIEAVARSLRHFLMGKVFSVASNTVVLLLVARVLEPAEYAIYVSLQALVAVISMTATVGEKRAVYRLLPEFRARGENFAAYRLLGYGILVRLANITLVSLVALALLPTIARLLNLSDWTWLIPWYLLVGGTRLLNFWIGALLESLLWQKQSQYSFAIGSIVKMCAMLLMAQHLHLETIVAIEGAVELLVLVLLGGGLWRKMRRDPQRGRGSPNWWAENRQRVLSIGRWGLIENYSLLFYGSAPNRFVAAHFLPPAEVALFGFADNVAQLIGRFMPVRFFIGMIRPVAMARFAEKNDFSQVASIASIAYRFNLLLLALGIALLLSVGEPLFAWVTSGKYTDAAWLVAGFLALFVTEGMRAVGELMAQAVERNRLDVFGNVIQSLSLFAAIPFLPSIGVWALVIANFCGTLGANLFVTFGLRRNGYRFPLPLRQMMLIATYGLLSGLLGRLLVTEAHWHFSVVGGVVVVAYALLQLLRPPFGAEERRVLMRLVNRKKTQVA